MPVEDRKPSDLSDEFPERIFPNLKPPGTIRTERIGLPKQDAFYNDTTEDPYTDDRLLSEVGGVVKKNSNAVYVVHTQNGVQRTSLALDPNREYQIGREVVLQPPRLEGDDWLIIGETRQRESEYVIWKARHNGTSYAFQADPMKESHLELDGADWKRFATVLGSTMTLPPGWYDISINVKSLGSSLLVVDMTQVGGDQGSDSAPASWTYDVEHNGTELATDYDPVSGNIYKRPSIGQLSVATKGIWAAGAIVWCNEALVGGDCDDLVGWEG